MAARALPGAPLSSTIVVGAGLGGLTAATDLVAAGREVEVLEARDRVGGRTWSRRLGNGATVEMGAEFILPGNTAVAGLAGHLGLGLWDKGMAYGRREPRGGIGASREAMDSAVRAVREALDSGEAETRSARSLLESLAIEPGAREVVLARLEISAAGDAGEVPATAMVGLAHIDDEPAPSVAGGNQGLSIALAERLGDAVRLGDAATAIEWSPEGATVRTAAGREVAADDCVIAVPASVVGGIEFRPALPRAVRDALGSVRYGHAAKLFVPLAEPAPPSAVMNVPERWWCWTATAAAGLPAPVVSCFAGSPAALERLETTAGPGRWLESLAATRPDLALEPAAAELSTWDDDPWARAAYSLAPSAAMTAALREPVGPLRFAGEHLGAEYAALMEGAIRSGRAAAASLAGAASPG